MPNEPTMLSVRYQSFVLWNVFTQNPNELGSFQTKYMYIFEFIWVHVLYHSNYWTSSYQLYFSHQNEEAIHTGSLYAEGIPGAKATTIHRLIRLKEELWVLQYMCTGTIVNENFQHTSFHWLTHVKLDMFNFRCWVDHPRLLSHLHVNFCGSKFFQQKLERDEKFPFYGTHP